MEPIITAATIVSIICHKGLEKLGESAGSGTAHVLEGAVEKIKNWLLNKPSLREPAEAVIKNPQNENDKQRLTSALATEMKLDPILAEKLTAIARASREPGTQLNQFLSTVGKAVNINTMNGGTLNL